VNFPSPTSRIPWGNVGTGASRSALARALVIFLVVLFVSVSARAGEEAKAVFRPAIEAGDRYRTEAVTRLDLLFTAAEGEEGIPASFETERVSVVQVLEAEEGRPVRLVETVETSREMRQSPALGGKIETPGRLQGTVEAARMPGGEATVDIRNAKASGAVLEAERTRLAEELTRSELRLLSEEPVAAGATWKRSGRDLMHLLPHVDAKAFQKGEATFRLHEIERKDGKRHAIIEVLRFSVSLGREEGMRILLEGKGRFSVLLEKGAVVSLAVEGEAKLQRGPAGSLEGKGVFRSEKKVRFNRE